MLSRSNPILTKSTRPPMSAGKASNKKCLPQKVVNEKGDADTICSSKGFELSRDVLVPRLQGNVRRQRSAPILSTNAANKPIKADNNSLPNKEVGKRTRPPSASPIISSENSSTTVVVPLTVSPSSDSYTSSATTTVTQSVCEALEKDPKLKALCASLGINQSPNTLVGPIEKGQLIIGTLQDSLHEFIRMKIKQAERRGEKFHIQQSGLDVAVRALRNADRSLKTIKESKQPVLGRARQQRSSESLLQCHRKTTEAVIRILSSTKEKFDKMENVGSKFLGGISLVSAYLSSTTSPPSTTGFSGYTTRRTSGTSILTTPVTPFGTTNATCSRARTATSSTSIGGGCRGGGKAIPTI